MNPIEIAGAALIFIGIGYAIGWSRGVMAGTSPPEAEDPFIEKEENDEEAHDEDWP